MPSKPGSIYLIPCGLGDNPRFPGVNPEIIAVCNAVDGFLAENPKTCRAFLKTLDLDKKLQDFEYYLLDKKSPAQDLMDYLKLLKEGKNLGIISEAGCPGIADPGALMVSLAQRNDINIIPLVGPSSILMAIMGSGLSGQQFTFHGYLPIKEGEQKKRLDGCIQQAMIGYSQVVMDTPYRNLRLFQTLVKQLPLDFKLCIAANITQKDEWIKTHSIAYGIKLPEPNIHKIPAILLFGL